MGVIDIFKTFHPNAEEYIYLLFKCTWNILQDRPHLGHKSNFSKFKKSEIISSSFSNHKPMRLDINYKKKTVRNKNTWRLNNTYLNKQQVPEEHKGKSRNF